MDTNRRAKTTVVAADEVITSSKSKIFVFICPFPVVGLKHDNMMSNRTAFRTTASPVYTSMKDFTSIRTTAEKDNISPQSC